MEQITLRQWKDSDVEPFATINQDPEVMRHFPALLSRAETEAGIDRQRRAIDQRGWGMWAVDVDGEFAGFTGLNFPSFSAHFTPCVEIGWRFAKNYWGRGIACRAALQALCFGFGILRLPEIVTFTAAENLRSRRLMERLGFKRDEKDDFDHPSIPEGHRLRRHVLYRLRLPLPPVPAMIK